MQEISYRVGERTAIVAGNTLILLDASPDAEFATTLWRLLTAGFDFAQVRGVLDSYSPVRLPDLGIASLSADTVTLALRGGIQATVSGVGPGLPQTFRVEGPYGWVERTLPGATEVRLWVEDGGTIGLSMPLVGGMVRAASVGAALAGLAATQTPVAVAAPPADAAPVVPVTSFLPLDEPPVAVVDPSMPETFITLHGTPPVAVPASSRFELAATALPTELPPAADGPSPPAQPVWAPPPAPTYEPIAEVFLEHRLEPARAAAFERSPAASADLWVTPPPGGNAVAAPSGAATPSGAAAPSAAAAAGSTTRDDALWVGSPPAVAPGFINARDNHTELVAADAFTPTPRVAPAIPAARRPSVWALRCPAAHLNPPSSATCRICDAVINDRQAAIVPRPSLGLLDFGNQMTISLEESLVIGRDPAESAVDGPRPVPIAHPSLSRRHLEVRLHEWMVVVIDLNSQNGTTVALPGGAPQALSGNDPVPIPPGTVVWLANQVPFTYLVPR